MDSEGYRYIWAYLVDACAGVLGRSSSDCLSDDEFAVVECRGGPTALWRVR